MKSPKLKIEMVDPKSLMLAPWNPKDHTDRGLKALDESLTLFGWMEPLTVWNGVVINGNGRLKKCLERGEKLVPIVRRDDLTEDQAKAYPMVSQRIAKFMVDNNDMIYEIAQKLPKSMVSPFYTESELGEMRDYLKSLVSSRSQSMKDEIKTEQVKPEKRQNMVLSLIIPLDLYETVGDVFDDWFREQVENHEEIRFIKKKKGGV